ncbi:MAG: hypothetical protein GX787_10180 [Tissierellia bacterium]|nr:hypothetical protein [Tissierellia bacterium]
MCPIKYLNCTYLIKFLSSFGAAMSGPFSVAASLVGIENLLKWMMKYPKKVIS